MKFLLVLVLLLTASPVFALDESIVGYCQTTKDPQQCITSFLEDVRAAAQARERAEERAFQLELAREQALGMALFGSGNALIQGMNQSFNNMRLAVPTPAAPRPYQPTTRPPLNCTTQTYGAQTYTNCY